MNNYIINFFIYVFYILLFFITQISILNPLFLLGKHYCIYIYIIFFLLYPYNNKKKYKFLILSFFIGWFIDHCMNTGGIHAFSSTLSSFLRSKILQFFYRNYFINKNDFSIYNVRFSRQIFYIFLLVFTHYISLLVLQSLKIANFFNKLIIFRFILSSIFTTILCIIYFFFKKIKL